MLRGLLASLKYTSQRRTFLPMAQRYKHQILPFIGFLLPNIASRDFTFDAEWLLCGLSISCDLVSLKITRE